MRSSLLRRVEALEALHRPAPAPRVVAELPDCRRYGLIHDSCRIAIAPRKPAPDDWLRRIPGSWRRLRPGEPVDESRIFHVSELACFAAAPPFMDDLRPGDPGCPGRIRREDLTDRDRDHPMARSRD